MKTITIKGKEFTFKNFDSCHNGVSDIYKLYKKPSSEKVAAFKKWEKILDCIFWMKGNSNCFTIYWFIKDKDWIERDVKITKGNNYILNGRRM